MPAVYADHPFPLMATPIAQMGKEREPDVFDKAASEMAWVHNGIIRGLNSIYLQAEHIKPADQTSFLNYILCWHILLDVHHSGEEADFFPHVEKITGEKGIMDANIEQHHMFHETVDAFVAYVKACLAGTEKYDGKKIMALIDAFGEPLMKHLADEIPTILGLKKHADKLEKVLPKLIQDEAEKNMGKVGFTTGLAWCMVNWDEGFENGLWAKFPPAPWFIKFVLRHIAYWVHRDWWKFGACDRMSQMQPLYALRD